MMSDTKTLNSNVSLDVYSEIEDEDANFNLNQSEFKLFSSSSETIVKNQIKNPINKILLVDDQQFNIEAIEIMMLYIFQLPTQDLCDHAFNGL